uniref:Uncharacterized protein n=1 Tax=Anopheles maculatus TaxID=74869 RepID=A0A182SHM3_9DIPT
MAKDVIGWRMSCSRWHTPPAKRDASRLSNDGAITSHHPSNGDEQHQPHHAKSKLHQNNLKNSANNQLHLHVHHQQQHHHQHQLSSASSTSSDHQHRPHQQSNGVGALIRTGNDPSNGLAGSGGGPGGGGVPATVKQSELIISSSNGSSTGGALERGKETRKSLNSSGFDSILCLHGPVCLSVATAGIRWSTFDY